MPMQFCFYLTHEHRCPNVIHCLHLGVAALGIWVVIANTSGGTIDRLLQAVDIERKRNTKIVEENLRLQEDLEQAKLELRSKNGRSQNGTGLIIKNLPSLFWNDHDGMT